MHDCRGPNFIHGVQDNTILQLARETGTQLHEWDESEAVIADGSLLAPDVVEEAVRILWTDILGAAFAHSAAHSQTIPPQRSLHEYAEERLASLFPHDDAAEWKRRLVLHLLRVWGAYVGSDVRRQSLKFLWLEATIDGDSGDNPFVAGTYRGILEAVQHRAVREADVRLDCPVTQVRMGGNGRRPALRVRDGSWMEFDHVVCSVPLGYLKAHPELFQPPLAPRIQAAIRNLGYGNLDKVYITFPSAFWHGPATSASDDNKPSTPHAGFTHWVSLTTTASSPDPPTHHALNLAALPPPHAHPTLVFYIHSSTAQHIASLPPPALLPLFQPLYALLPHYHPANPACTPVALLATAWAADPWAGHGSYSNFPTGLAAGDADLAALRLGAPAACLWFAGEHTAPVDACGTTTGAYRSGEAVAARLLRAGKGA